MPGRVHRVVPGDCIFSIAVANHIPWEKIWTHDRNRSLAEQRGNPGVLAPGDLVYVPELEKRVEEGQTGQAHEFVKPTPLVELRIALVDFGEPRKNEPYWLEIDGERIDGATTHTDDDGLARVRIPGGIYSAELIVGESEDVYELDIGHIDPIDTVSGLHGRLENLGHDTGGVDTDHDEESVEATLEFLESLEEPNPPGNPANPDDGDVQDLLEREYGS